MARLALLLAAVAAAFGQTKATVDIDTTRSTSLNANFSGFNDEVSFPVEYYDYRVNNLAAQLSPGWVRYPSGIFADAFNWQTGLMVPAWAAQFQGTNIGTLIISAVPWVAGKGGGSFVDAANRANFLGAKLIIDVNAFTDTPQSIGQMAAFAKANHIPVAVWELANEPYFFKTFFSTGADYLTKVKPFRDAIKAADPGAIVAIFLQDAAAPQPNAWDQSILNYPNPYWDAITYHHYPAQTATTFAQEMADDNGVLYTNSAGFVTGYLQKVTPPGMKFVVSEFLPSNDGLGSGTSLTDGTLYGAIYAAEYVMRMSAVPAMLYVGPHAMTGQRGVYAADAHYTDVDAAGKAGKSINTLNLNFGFFLVAQPLGVAVLNGVLRNATQVESTTVTGGATVAATGSGQIPALYAQAYASAAGQQSLVITNKSAIAHQTTIRLNGTPVSGNFPAQFISGTDPAALNTASNPTVVTVQSGTFSNPVTIPPYSVMRLDLNAPAIATATSSASFAPGPVAPNELVTLFGPSISSETLHASNLPLPLSLGGISVTITDSAGNSQPAPLVGVSTIVANILIPAGLASGPAKVAVLNGSTPILTGTMTIANSAPGLFSMNSDGAGVAAAIPFRITASNQTVLETAFACDPNYARSCLGVPLTFGASGDTLFVALFGTGIRGASSVQCFVAGQSVPVQYAGEVASSPGLDQVNISIPKSLAGSGDVRVYLVADGVASNVVGLTIQ